jgi:hypothetical protein
MSVAVLLGSRELAGDLVDLILHALEEGGVTTTRSEVVVHQFNYKIIRRSRTLRVVYIMVNKRH